jgi:hypothetical protein
MGHGMTFLPTRPTWAIRAAKLFSRDCALVMIRYHPDWESVEMVHAGNIASRELLEAAQMSIVKILERLPR